MNSLMRMRYGRSGNRLERILVSAPVMKAVSTPLWLRLLVLSVWIVVPLIVSRHTNIPLIVPKTVIDISRLTPPQPIEREKPEQAPPPPRHSKMQVKPEKPPVQTLPDRPDKLPLPQLPEVKPPVISRPASTPPDIREYQPRISRKRIQSGTESAAPSPTRIRRENPATPAGEASSGGTAISRTRGASSPEEPSGKGGVALLRRSPATAELPPGSAAIQQPATRGARNSGSPEASAGGGARIAAGRDRTQPPISGEEGGTAHPGVVRGISLMSLEICSSPQAEEDAIKAVLSVIGSRRECVSEKGEFDFKGTKRISSFNLIIIPAKGRKPTNRCEELENAYKCLKTR